MRPAFAISACACPRRACWAAKESIAAKLYRLTCSVLCRMSQSRLSPSRTIKLLSYWASTVCAKRWSFHASTYWLLTYGSAQGANMGRQSIIAASWSTSSFTGHLPPRLGHWNCIADAGMLTKICPCLANKKLRDQGSQTLCGPFLPACGASCILISQCSALSAFRPCSYTQKMLTSLLAHKNGFLLGGTYCRHCQEIQQQGLRKTDDAMSIEATHALNSVQGSSMAADAAANDDQVIVVFALCCCYCQAPCAPPTALPAHSMGAAGTQLHYMSIA